MTLKYPRKFQYAMLMSVVVMIASWELAPLQAQTFDFDKEIAPILVSHCLE